MKLSFSTLSCPNWTWEEIIEQALRHGYEGIEVRGINGEMYLPDVAIFQEDHSEDTLAHLKRVGLTITDLGSSVKFHEADTYSENIVEGKAYIDLAKRLGISYVRVFGNNIPDLCLRAETISRVSCGINELCQYGEDKGVSCLLETHGDFVDVKSLQPIVENCHFKNFGILWDVAHTFKVYGEEVNYFLDTLGSHIKHVHIKDLKSGVDGYDLCMIGEGDIPLDKVVKDLIGIGYDGYLSLEWEKKWVPELEAPEIVVPIYAKVMKALL